MGFAEEVKKSIGRSVPNWIPRGKHSNGKKYDHILLNLSDNFIDGAYPEKCDIKGDLMKGSAIKPHPYATHMNSSQTMCINFFNKFFEKEEYERILLDILRDCEITIAADDQIKAAAFEYEPCRKEKTNFDFFILLCSGKRISFEIKYTENEFDVKSRNESNSEKYQDKWNKIYKKMVTDSPYLCESKISSSYEFCKNYQINRNIAYAKENDYVLFLTPKANDEIGIKMGRQYIDEFHNSHIKNIYWEDIMEITKIAVSNFAEIKEYYAKFYDKYIKIIKRG